MKIAFDQNVPIAMVRVLSAFASENQFKRISGSFEFKTAAEYTPKRGDDDYRPNDDVPWLKRFAKDGGKVVVSGDTKMKERPHERLALIEGGFLVIFFESQWSNWKFWRKCALLICWWPVIAAKIKRARKASFYHIPCNWLDGGKLRWVSNKDPKLLKIERRKATARKKKIAKVEESVSGHGPLFDHAAKRKRRND